MEGKQEGNPFEFLKKYPLFSGVFIFLLVLGLGYFIFFKHQYQRIKEYKAGQVDKSYELSEAKKYLEKLSILYDNYSKISPENLKQIESMFPESEDVPNLLLAIEDLVTRNGFKLLGVSISNPKVDTKGFKPGIAAVYTDKNFKAFSESLVKPRSVEISLNISGGTYKDLKNFLTSVESSLRIMDVINFSFSPKQSEYNVNLRCYFSEK